MKYAKQALTFSDQADRPDAIEEKIALQTPFAKKTLVFSGLAFHPGNPVLPVK